MTVSVQQLTKELEIFGVDCEESLTEKRESLPPPRTPAGVQARPARGSQPPSLGPRTQRERFRCPLPSMRRLGARETNRTEFGDLEMLTEYCLDPRLRSENMKYGSKSLRFPRWNGDVPGSHQAPGHLQVWKV